jgi:lipoprotein NlpI
MTRHVFPGIGWFPSPLSSLRSFRTLAISASGAPWAVWILSAAIASAQPADTSPQASFDRAIADFRSGRIAESVTGFDDVAKRTPREAPFLWQRGIALYLAGRYQDCRAQFESHRTVNPDDVENAAWHFACVSRAESPQRAVAALLPVGPDSRRPMRQIYDMFRGTLPAERLLEAAGSDPSAQFYAHLYLGLYFDALGTTSRAIEHMTAASDSRFAAVGGYMHTVAVVHLTLLKSPVQRAK